MARVVQVGMADYKAAVCPNILMTAGLGSCVGVCLWDPATRIGGLAHIMLPSSVQARRTDNKGKFADTAILAVIQEMSRLGANPARLVAKIAGGAQMFNFGGTTDIMRIGDRNAQAVQQVLKNEKIKILFSDIGGSHGRTIYFMTENGKLTIRTIEHGERVV
ncbi:MAG: chemotaxis protein CheD [Syntrophomonadaceae bacterium]|nr:chemotaxis protein CheD [Syntrophomonadaceae bacterium]